ncbi:MAG: F0F1 ATP synthase subunit A, partial [Bacteroidota bacterium]
IWFANLFGLTPFNSNIAGNISVTAALAVLTFILTQVNASKDHWIHVFNTPGVPGWLKFGIPLMPAVEFLGLFTKPFALAVRLFANITAGHFMVLGLVSLIFIMGKGGTNFGGAMAIMPLSVLFTIVIFILEMIVAIVQPFIFTLLTAVFIGMAMESHDDHH